MDDCLLFIDGAAYNDIDYRDAMCLQWLKDVVAQKVTIDFIHTDLNRADYPDTL